MMTKLVAGKPIEFKASIAKMLRRIDLPLFAILALGFALRIWSIRFGLPYTYHPDEGVPVGAALRIIQTGNLDPQFFNWPSLLIYLDALVYLAFFASGRLAGVFSTPADLPYPDIIIMGVGKAALPEEFILGRGLTAIFGTLSVLWVFLIARQFGMGKATAYIAALLFAVEAIDVRNSQFIRPDTFGVFFLLLTVLFALKAADEPRIEYYLLGGAAAGLAASSKYNFAVGLIAILAALVLQFKSHVLLRKELWGTILIAVLAFLITTPFAILDPQRFLQTGLFEDVSNYSAGHSGTEGSSFLWYVNFLWSTQGLTLLFALVGLLLILLRREKKGWVLISFPIVYFVFICFLATHFDATIMPILPFLSILASLCLMSVYRAAVGRWQAVRALVGVALLVVLALLVFPSLSASSANNVRLLQVDGREYARQWIDANLPTGSRIALESYSPYVDRKKFVVEAFSGLQDHPPEWYAENGFEYLVFSQGLYGRYFADPTLYGEQVGKYNALFSRFQEVAQFEQNGYEIRIYGTGVVLPEHRVAAHFGDYGDLIELVGYDQIGQWHEGEPLRIRLFWRALYGRAEPLEVEFRLLGGKEQVGGMRADLYQGKPVAAGMFSQDWTIPLSGQQTPGLYRLQLSVFQTRYSYRAPVITSANEKEDVLTVGPFKVYVKPSSLESPSALRVNLQWEDGISLLSYSMPDQQVHGAASLPLAFYWQARSRPSRDYTMFVHIVDESDKVRAQMDTQPRKGDYPTTIWDKGEVVPDSISVDIPADLPLGTYRIEIGWYELASLARLQVVNSDGQVLGDHSLLPTTIQVIR